MAFRVITTVIPGVRPKNLLLSKKELAVLKKILRQGLLPELADFVDAEEIKTLLKLAGRVETL